jgi:hypothetical protein
MRQLTSELHVARHLLWQNRAWLWFIEIPIGPATEGGPDRVFRLVRNTRHVEAAGVVWQACELEIELPSDDGQGALGEVVLRVPNVSRLPIAYVESEGELLGRQITVCLAHEAYLSSFIPDLCWTHDILRATATPRTMSIVAAHPVTGVRLPSRLCTRQVFPQLLPSGGIYLGGVAA